MLKWIREQAELSRQEADHRPLTKDCAGCRVSCWTEPEKFWASTDQLRDIWTLEQENDVHEHDLTDQFDVVLEETLENLENCGETLDQDVDCIEEMIVRKQFFFLISTDFIPRYSTHFQHVIPQIIPLRMFPDFHSPEND